MPVQLGSGEWTFEVHENWAKLPDEIVLGDVATIGKFSRTAPGAMRSMNLIGRRRATAHC